MSAEPGLELLDFVQTAGRKIQNALAKRPRPGAGNARRRISHRRYLQRQMQLRQEGGEAEVDQRHQATPHRLDLFSPDERQVKSQFVHTGRQTSSLAALFDSNRLGLSNESASTKKKKKNEETLPLRHRKLPQSFFREPCQENACQGRGECVWDAASSGGILQHHALGHAHPQVSTQQRGDIPPPYPSPYPASSPCLPSPHYHYPPCPVYSATTRYNCQQPAAPKSDLSWALA